MNKFGVLMRLNIRNRLAALRGGGLRGEGSGFLGSSESHFTCGRPGNCVALNIGNGNDGVVEGRLNMCCAAFNVLAVAAAGDGCFTLCCHIKFLLLTSSCLLWSCGDPCGYVHWSWSAVL